MNILQRFIEVAFIIMLTLVLFKNNLNFYTGINNITSYIFFIIYYKLKVEGVYSLTCSKAMFV